MLYYKDTPVTNSIGSSEEFKFLRQKVIVTSPIKAFGLS